jgi:hypothetical protein
MGTPPRTKVKFTHWWMCKSLITFGTPSSRTTIANICYPLVLEVRASCSGQLESHTAMTSQYTKEQREGLARLLDTIAASAFVGGVVGLAGHSLISPMEVVVLFVVYPILLTFAWKLRRPTP